MSELKMEYAGKVEFNVFRVTEVPLEEVEEFEFGRLGHGLVGFDRTGKAVLTIPGHNYGKKEIVERIQVLLR